MAFRLESSGYLGFLSTHGRGELTLSVLFLGAVLLMGCTQGPAPPATVGQRLYVANCLACHQSQGEGIRGVQPPLAGTPVPTGEPAPLLAWVMFGIRPNALPQGMYSGMMPQFGYLSDTQLAELLTYVRSSFGNHAPAVTPDMVATARRVHLNR
jgi:hypothetical protein